MYMWIVYCLPLPIFQQPFFIMRNVLLISEFNLFLSRDFTDLFSIPTFIVEELLGDTQLTK